MADIEYSAPNKFVIRYMTDGATETTHTENPTINQTAKILPGIFRLLKRIKFMSNSAKPKVRPIIEYLSSTQSFLRRLFRL